MEEKIRAFLEKYLYNKEFNKDEFLPLQVKDKFFCFDYSTGVFVIKLCWIENIVIFSGLRIPDLQELVDYICWIAGLSWDAFMQILGKK